MKLKSNPTEMTIIKQRKDFSLQIGATLLVLLLIAGCGPETDNSVQAPLVAEPTRTPVPTFTPTPQPAEDTQTVASVATPAEPVVAAVTATPEQQEDPSPPPVDAPTETPLPEATEVVPLLTVAQDAVNVRGGPGTDYPVIGAASAGASFAVTGRNEAGDWWQICCVDGQPGWLFSSLVTVENVEGVGIAANIPAPPPTVAEPAAVAEAPATNSPPPVEAPAPSSPPPAEQAPIQNVPGTAGNFDPSAQYHIVHYRVLGFDDNNGGIFNKGGQQFIFLSVLDENGNGIDGVTVKDAVGDKLNVVTGSKGPGKAEIKMDWDPYKLYVATDPSGPVTSQISNQMNNPFPHIPDVIGLLGPIDNEYALCPTPEINCTPPFFTVHFSYEITFQRVR
jgi:uncharacterized protein YraI